MIIDNSLTVELAICDKAPMFAQNNDHRPWSAPPVEHAHAEGNFGSDSMCTEYLWSKAKKWNILAGCVNFWQNGLLVDIKESRIMAYINSVIIQGNLVRDPELNQLPRGSCVATFTVAVNRSYPKRDGSWQNDVSYFDCETWAAEAQRSQEELQKGSHVKVIGRLRQDRWQDREGHHHSKIKIIAEYFEKQASPNRQLLEPKELAAQAEALHASVQVKEGETSETIDSMAYDAGIPY